jgi:hypothetical protein
MRVTLSCASLVSRPLPAGVLGDPLASPVTMLAKGPPTADPPRHCPLRL